MNERVRELAEKSGYIDKGSNHTAYKNFNHEKFAELIIHDCVIFIHAHYERDYDKLWRKDLTDKLQEHFGVEE